MSARGAEAKGDGAPDTPARTCDDGCPHAQAQWVE
jgi:hypothetical protein